MTVPRDAFVTKARQCVARADDEPVTEAEARRAVDIAAAVREQTRTALNAEGVTLKPIEGSAGN